MKLIGSSQQSGSPPPVPQAQVEALPFLVRRGRQLVAAFAQRSEAGNWTRDYSVFKDSNATFYIHTANAILCAFRNGEEVEVP